MFDCTCNRQNSLLLNLHNGNDAPQNVTLLFVTEGREYEAEEEKSEEQWIGGGHFYIGGGRRDETSITWLQGSQTSLAPTSGSCINILKPTGCVHQQVLTLRN